MSSVLSQQESVITASSFQKSVTELEYRIWTACTTYFPHFPSVFFWISTSVVICIQGSPAFFLKWQKSMWPRTTLLFYIVVIDSPGDKFDILHHLAYIQESAKCKDLSKILNLSKYFPIFFGPFFCR